MPKNIDRDVLSAVAHEAHMMGRIYNKMGEPEKPSEVYDMIEKMVDEKITQLPPTEGDKRSEVLEEIATDMKNDAKNFDGRPFNGNNVAEYFGNQGAAIAALADILKSVLEQISTED